MKTADLAEVQARLSFYVEQAEKEGPIVITRNGKAVAVIIAPLDDDDLESLLLARSPRFQALLERSRNLRRHTLAPDLPSKSCTERSGYSAGVETRRLPESRYFLSVVVSVRPSTSIRGYSTTEF